MARYRSVANRHWRDAITRARRRDSGIRSSRHRYVRRIYSGHEVVSSLLAIIDRLLLLVVRWAVAREQAKAQRLRDALEENPADWYAAHFDSVSNPTSTPANKTNTDDTKAN